MRIKLFLTHSICFVLFSFYLNAQTDLLNYLPEKAGMIIDIDCGSLSQKVSRQELMEMKFFDSVFKKAKAESKQIFAEPTESGINYNDHLYLVFNMAGDDPNNYIAVYGKVSDEAKLSQLLQKIEDKTITRKTTGQNKMIISKNFLFAWNNTVFAVYAKTPFDKRSEAETRQTQAQKKKELALLEHKCIELLTPKTQNIITNKYFETMSRSKGDFKIWIDNNSLMSGLNRKGPWAAFNMNNPLQAHQKAIIVNFEKGKIVSNSYSYYDETTLPTVQNMYAEKINADLIKKIPSGNLLGLYALSIKPGAVKNFIENSGILKEFNNPDEQPGFDPITLLDHLKGDVVMAVTMPEHVNDDTSENKLPFSGARVFIAATINDEMKVNKFIDSLKLAIEEKRKQKDTVGDNEIVKKKDFLKGMKSSMKVENGVFLLTVGGAEEEAGTISANTYNNLVNEYGQRPTLMIIDLKAIMSMVLNFTNKMRHTEDQPEISGVFGMFDKMIISGGKFENDAMVTTQEVKFTNAEENSLNQMMKMIDLAFSAISKSSKVKDIKVKEN